MKKTNTIILAIGIILIFAFGFLLFGSRDKKVSKDYVLPDGEEFEVRDLFLYEDLVYYVTSDKVLYCATPDKEGKIAVIPDTNICVFHNRFYYTVDTDIYSCNFEGDDIQLFFQLSLSDRGHLESLSIKAITDSYMVLQFLSKTPLYYVLDMESLELQKLSGSIFENYCIMFLEDSGNLYFVSKTEGMNNLYSYNIKDQKLNYLMDSAGTFDILSAVVADTDLYFITASGIKNDLWCISLKSPSDMRHVDISQDKTPDCLGWDGTHLFVSLNSLHSEALQGEICLVDRKTLEFITLIQKDPTELRTWKIVSDGEFVYWYFDKVKKQFIGSNGSKS